VSSSSTARHLHIFGFGRKIRGESRLCSRGLTDRGLVAVRVGDTGFYSWWLCRLLCRGAAPTVQVVRKDIFKVVHGLFSWRMLLNPARKRMKKAVEISWQLHLFEVVAKVEMRGASSCNQAVVYGFITSSRSLCLYLPAAPTA
jgi:hypothetical protein